MKTVWVALCAIVTVFCCCASSLCLSASSLPPTSVVMGDLDQNGVLTSADARIVMRYLVGNGSFTAQQRTQADMDGNARIDTLDIRKVLELIALDETPETIIPSTTTTSTTTTTKPSLDDDGYYDDVVKP